MTKNQTVNNQYLEKRLISLAKENDRFSFCQLVTMHQGSLRGFLRNMCNGDFALADDLAQEAFILAYNKLSLFREESSFKTWLFRIAYRQFLYHKEKNQRRFELLQDNYHETSTNNDNNLRLDILNALDNLNENEKNALLLNIHLGYCHEDVAKVLALPLGSVKSLILRSKEKIKSYLNKDTKDLGESYEE